MTMARVWKQFGCSGKAYRADSTATSAHFMYMYYRRMFSIYRQHLQPNHDSKLITLISAALHDYGEGVEAVRVLWKGI